MTALREEFPRVSAEVLCGLSGKKRRWYYASSKPVVSGRRRRKLTVGHVLYYRSCRPGIGGVKLHLIPKSESGEDVTHGRDSFLKLPASEGLMLPKNKRRRTTDSRHPYRKCPNLIQGITDMYANHIRVADITYVWIRGGVLYPHPITDVYPHAVRGWCQSETMEAADTSEALLMAVRTAGGGNLCGTTLHSDRGSRHACHIYVETLVRHHIRISMTERYNPTDNPVAERQNGTFKAESIYRQDMYRDYGQACMETSKAIAFYNCRWPHRSIGMECPTDVYGAELPGKKLWIK